jgi:hypothetical protein
MPVQNFNDDSVQLFCEVVGSGRRVDEQIGRCSAVRSKHASSQRTLATGTDMSPAAVSVSASLTETM